MGMGLMPGGLIIPNPWDEVDAGLARGGRIGQQSRNAQAYRDGGLDAVQEQAGRAGDFESMTMARQQRRFADDERQRGYEAMQTIGPWARNVIRATRSMDPARAGAFLNQHRQRFLDFGLTDEQIEAGIAGLSDADPAVRQEWQQTLDMAFSQHENPEWEVVQGTGQVYAVDPSSGQVQTGGRVEVAPDWQTNGTTPYRVTPEGQVVTGQGSIPHRPNLYSGGMGEGAYSIVDAGEVEALGLPPGSYQRNNATGQITVLGRQRGQYTDAAASSAQFASRMAGADQTLVALEDSLTSPEGVFMAQAGAGSQEERRVRQAQREFVNAILRRESGAVISDSEFASAAQQYFPQPGDGADVIEQKRQARQRAFQGLMNASQGAYEEWYGEGSSTPAPRYEPGPAPRGSSIGSMVGARGAPGRPGADDLDAREQELLRLRDELTRGR